MMRKEFYEMYRLVRKAPDGGSLEYRHDRENLFAMANECLMMRRCVIPYSGRPRRARGFLVGRFRIAKCQGVLP